MDVQMPKLFPERNDPSPKVSPPQRMAAGRTLFVFLGLLAFIEIIENAAFGPGNRPSVAVGLGNVLLVGLASFPLLWILLLRPLRRQEHMQQELNRELELIVRGTGVGVWEWEVQTGNLRVNERWAGILGYTVQELEPISIQTWMDRALTEDLEHSNRLLQEVFSGRQAEYLCEARMVHRDGSIIWVLDQGRVTEWSPEGLPLRMMGTHLDITARKRQEEETAAANRELEHERRMFLDGPLITYIMRNEVDLPIEYISPNVKTVTGYTVKEILDGSAGFHGLVHPEDQPRLCADADRAIESGLDHFDDAAYRIRHKDGHWMWFVDHTVLIRDGEGRVTHFQGYAQDISAVKEAELARLDLERQMQQAQRMESLGVLAGGVAHDFNNILMTILGNAELAQDGVQPDSELKRDLLEIQSAARQAAGLANQMLAYSGRSHFQVGPVDLGRVVEKLLPLLKSGVARTATLRSELEPHLPRFTGDEAQLQQVVLNLVANSAESLPGGRGDILVRTGLVECTRSMLEESVIGRSATREYELDPGPFLLLEVVDDGSGMDPAVQQRVFDPFFSTRFAGRGLGMAAVLGIVRGHRGTVILESSPGNGTRVRILLPASGVADVRLPTTGSSGRTIGNGSPRVLVVDDEEAVRRMASRMLDRCGCRVETAADGLQALSRLAEDPEPFDIVMLDLVMPRLDGEGTLAELRRTLPAQKVLMCSGHEWQDTAVGLPGRPFAPVGFIQKPYSTATLRMALEELLEGVTSSG
jgi:two-component system cell cycle sensor histidine kinase/response regulator CckA